MAAKLPPLFKLTPDYTKRGYSPWHSLGDVYQPKRESQLVDVVPLAKTWKRFTATFAKEKKQPDFMYGGGHYFATPAVFPHVKEFLGDAVEGLPVKVKGGPDLDVVYLLHSLATAEVSSEAKVTRYSSGKIMRVDEYAFSAREIASKHFFICHTDVVVSGEFRAMIEAHNLTGLGFEPLRGYRQA